MSQQQTKALKPVDEIRNNLAKMGEQFSMALPKHIPVEKFNRVAITAISSNPSLLKSDRASLFASVMKCAQAGLLPDGKEAALVPFKDQVQFMPMISGILKLIRNSGELSTITAQVVHKNDEFEWYIDGTGEHIKHKPNIMSDRGEAFGSYALAVLKDGAVYFEFMNKDQIMAVKKVSRSANNGPWAGAFEYEMWKKTVIRRLAKRMPVSTDLDGVFKSDDDDYDFDDVKTAADSQGDKPASETPKPAPRRSKLKDAMTGATPAQEPAAPPPEPPAPEPVDAIEAEIVDASYSVVDEAGFSEEIPI